MVHACYGTYVVQGINSGIWYLVPGTVQNTQRYPGIYGGPIVNRTYGDRRKPEYFASVTNNFWSYLLWSPVILIVHY